MNIFKNFSLHDPFTLHIVFMVLVFMPVIWLTYNTVKLGRTGLQSTLATAYICFLMLFVMAAFITVQLFIIPLVS